jgi:hypothetical protein
MIYLIAIALALADVGGLVLFLNWLNRRFPA